MKNRMLSAAGALAIGLLAAACSSGGGGTAAPGPSASPSASTPAASAAAPTKYPVKKNGNVVTVALRKIDGLPVPTLTDGFGRAVYMFDKDTDGKSHCNKGCDLNWQVIAAFGDGPVAGGGVKQELLGAIKRYNGVVQATYNGHPPYYYTGNGKTIEGDT